MKGMEKMEPKDDKYLHSEITNLIFQSFYKVYNGLGIGFEKKHYIKALSIELNKLNVKSEIHKRLIIYYEQIELGEYIADLVVDNKVLISVETDTEIDSDKEQFLFTKLRACELEVGLLLNFGKVPESKRKIYTNDRKKNIS